MAPSITEQNQDRRLAVLETGLAQLDQRMEQGFAESRKEHREDNQRIFELLDQLRNGQAQGQVQYAQLKAIVEERQKDLPATVAEHTKEISKLTHWRDIIVGGSLVIWFGICVTATILWDIGKAYIEKIVNGHAGH